VITGAATDLGTVVVGSAGTALTFTVTNKGGVNSGAIKVSATPGQFVVSTDCDDKDLAAKGTCTFTAKYQPIAGDVGPKQGTLKATGASVANPAFLGVTGTAVPAAKLAVEPNVLEFGSLPAMQESAPLTLVVSNVGGASTGALKVENTGAQFKVTGDTCAGAVLTAAGATKTCSIIVTFTPTRTDTDATGNIVVTDTTGAAGSISASLHGTAIERPGITISPNRICPQYSQDDSACSGTRIANKVIGQTTSQLSFTVTNTTLPAEAPDSGTFTLEITGAAAADFAVVQNNCTAPLLSVSSQNTTCVFTLTFKPSAAGLRNAVLTLKTSRGGIAQVNLEGKGLPVIELQPLNISTTHTGLDFGQVALGHNDPSAEPSGNSQPYRVWVRDTTQTDRNTTVTVTLPKPNPADFVWPTSATAFSIATGTLMTPPVGLGSTGTLAANINACDNRILSFALGTDGLPSAEARSANAALGYAYDSESGYFYCTFPVQFYPQSARGALSAVLSAAGTGGGSSSLTLTGTASGPLVINPSPALIGNPVAVGMSADSNLTLTISNQGAIPQNNLTFALSGTGSGDFQIVGTDCWGVNNYTYTPSSHAYADLAAVSLAAGGSCKVWFGFEPTTEGPYSVTFTVTAANAAGATDDEVATATIIATGSKTYGALTVTPNPGTFADTAFGKTDAAPVTFTVTNNGTLDATNLTYVVSSNFTKLPSVGVAGACSESTSFVLAGGASCTIQVRATPTATPADVRKSLVTGTLTVTSTPGGAVVVPLTYYETSSIMIADGGAAASSIAYTFAPAGVGSLVDHNFVVSNIGSSAVSLAFTTASPFIVREAVEGLTPAVCAFGTNTLAAGASCTLVVRNSNTAVGVISPEAPVTVTISDSVTSANQARLKLSSTTLSASSLVVYGMTPDPNSPIDLGTVPIATSTVTPVGGKATVWYRNVGQVATLPLTAKWSVNAGTETATDAEFIVDSDETSCVGKAVAPGEFCTMSVHFTPNTTARSAMTARTATLTLTDATGVAVYFTAQPLVQASVYVEDVTGAKAGFFQFTQLAPTAAPVETRTFRITNASGTTRTVSAATSGVFVVTGAATNSCGASGASKDLANGETCQFNVTFTPSSASPIFQKGTITVFSGTTLGLMGRVQQPASLEIRKTLTSGSCGATCVDFGIVGVGGTKTQDLTIVNMGDVAMAAAEAGLVIDITSTATGAGFTYAGAGDHCTGVKLQAYGTTGDRCVVTVTATGAALARTTPSAATLTVGKGTPTTAPTASYGTRATVLLAADAILTGANVFTSAAVTGYTSQTYTITNGANANDYMPTGVVTASLAGTNADQFTIVGTNCPPNVGLASGANCTVDVRFTPKALSTDGNAFTATLNVAATPGGPKSTSIQGTPKSALSIDPPGSGTATPKTYAMGSVGVTFRVTKDATAVATAPLKTSITGSDFMLVNDRCYGEILSGSGSASQCDLSVKYIGRSTATAKTATITVNGGSAGQSVAIIVSSPLNTEAATH
jgi:hypothetical protein